MTIPIFIGIWFGLGILSAILYIFIKLYICEEDIFVRDTPVLLLISIIGVMGFIISLCFLIDILSSKYKDKVIFKAKTKNNT